MTNMLEAQLTNASTQNGLFDDAALSDFGVQVNPEILQWRERLANQANLSLVDRNPDLIFFHDEHLAFLRESRLKKQADRVSKSNPNPKDSNTLFDDEDQPLLADQVVRYGSGVLSPAYWKAYTSISHPVCVTAVELGEASLTRVCDYLRAGGTVLMDSGAFLYRADFSAMPWAKVEQVYRAVSEAASLGGKTAKVTFILPDAVGSQPASLSALREWGARIQAAIGPHHERLLPIQRGDLTPSLYIKAALAALGHSPVSGIAVPCKAKAFPAEYLNDLANIDAAIPHRVHFLGLSDNRKKLDHYLTHLGAAWPDARVSCDAVRHRCAVGKRETITAMRQEIVDGPIFDLVEKLVDLTDPLDEADEAQADQLCLANPGMDIRAARHRVMLDSLLAEWGPWATEVATRAYLNNVEPSVLASYWELVDAINQSLNDSPTEAVTG
jgi:hypothetical protein